MKKELEDIVNFLRVTKEGKPQVVVAREDKKAIAWYPGNVPNEERELGGYIANAKDKKFKLGITGRFFDSREMTQKTQDSWLHWISVDIDEPVNGVTKESFKKTFLMLRTEFDEECSIRTSNSGRGLHLFFRLASPIKNANNNSVKIAFQHFKERIEQSMVGGMYICKILTNLYVLGGKQAWLYKTSGTIELDQEVLDGNAFRPSSCDCCGGETIDTSYMNEAGVDLVEKLVRSGIWRNVSEVPRKTQVYIKNLYKILENTPYEFQTVSPMSSNDGRSNGFIEVDDMNLKIFASADNKIVKTIQIF